MILALNHPQPLSGNNMQNKTRHIFLYLLLVGLCVQAQSYYEYTVKVGDSRWKMAQDFGISLDSLSLLNPHLSKSSMELPVGVSIYLPVLSKFSNVLETPLKSATYSPAQLSDQIPFLDSLVNPVAFDFVYALPFRLDKMNFQDSIMGQKIIAARRDMKLSLSFYSGALMAIDSLKKFGINISPIPVDSELDGTFLYRNLYKDSLAVPHAIFGPLSAAASTVVLRYAQQHKIPAVLPVVSSGNLPYDKAFYPVPNEKVLRDKLLSYAQKTYRGQKVLLIADRENASAAAQIKALFPRAFQVALADNISIDIDFLSKQLDSVNPNWVFVETENLKLVSSVSSILNANITKKVNIKMFTTNRNKAFENDIIDNQHLSALQFCFSTFYKKTTDSLFTAAYEARFGDYPETLAVRGFDLTMDLALKMAYYKGWEAAQKTIGPVVYTDHKLYYSSLFTPSGLPADGLYNTASFIMQYEDMDVKLIE